ncbi:hypothetical protein AB6A23_21110 [Paenibacillus tarimensis]
MMKGLKVWIRPRTVEWRKSMSGVYLSHIKMKRESKSYTDSLYAILTAAGLFDGPKCMLSGLSGMAFKFSVHERLLPLSVSAYGQWGVEHEPAVRNLGLFTIWDGGRTRHPTSRYYREDAVRWTKESLDRGVGAIYWIPEFGVIHGYDDADRVFFVQDGLSADDHIILYDNFGLNFTPFWYCQVFGDRVHVPLEEIILESLRLAVHDWDTPHKTLPDKEIASGRLAYEFLARGLESGDYDEHGALYILDSYQYSRTEIMLYLQEGRGIWEELDEACVLYERLVRTISAIEECMVLDGTNRRVDRRKTGELVNMLEAAALLEDQALCLFKSISSRYPDPTRSIVPRWGSHSPR